MTVDIPAWVHSLLSMCNKPFHFYVNYIDLLCCVIDPSSFLLCCILFVSFSLRRGLNENKKTSFALMQAPDKEYRWSPLSQCRCSPSSHVGDEGSLLRPRHISSLLPLEFSFQSISGCSSLVDLLVKLIPLLMWGCAL